MKRSLPKTLDALSIRPILPNLGRTTVRRQPILLVNQSVPATKPLSTQSTRLQCSHRFDQTDRFPQNNQPIQLRSAASQPITALVVALSAAILYWSLFADEAESIQSSEGQSTVFEMATNQAPPGHLGNLSAEQEKKLQEFWQAIAGVTGWSDEGSAVAEDAAKEAAPEPAPEQSSGGWGFGMFKKNDTSSSNDPFGKGGSEDDKFGLAKQFNEILAKQSPESIRETMWEMTKHDHPDGLALRFLRARKWDVKKALIMFVTALNWRKTEIKVDDDVMKNGEGGAAKDEKEGSGSSKQLGADFLAQLRMGKSFLHGVDKEGRPICMVRVRLHRGGEQSAESIERYTVHVIETARLLLQPPVETATIIFDMTSFTLANMDYAPVKFMIKCFEANYPESLGAVLIHNAPWLFQGIWRIIKGWLDPVVANKVHFTNGRSGLEEYIAPSQILKELGGDEDWEYKYVEPAADENAAMEDTAAKDKIMSERVSLAKEFEEATKAWLREGESDAGKQARGKRDTIADQMRENYWKLDPYIRARSLYDRQGVIGAGGAINYYPGESSGAK